MKNDKMSTMRRRKVIEESRGERDAAKAASDQTSAIGDISLGLKDLQGATELTAEMVESKGNEILGSLSQLNDSIEDNTAASELAAEASEKTTAAVKDSISDLSDRISDKLTRLSDMLEAKLGNSVQSSTPVGTPDTTVAVVEDALPVEIVNPGLPELIEDLLPEVDNGNNDPNDTFFPPSPDVTHDRDKDKEKDDGTKDLMKGLFDTTKKGFKATVSITDRIAGMLFKYTVTALAEAAKMAALLFSIVLAFDVIRIHFKYWSDKFLSDFDAFSSEAGEWGSLLGSIFGTLENIKKFWEAGDWGGLTIALVKGVADILHNLGELISLGMSKVAAAILSIIPGMGDAALSVEGAALEGFQERTGNSLSEEDQNTVAEYQNKKIENGENIYDKFSQGKTYLYNKATGNANTSDFITSDDKEAQIESLKSMDPEERKEVLKKGNEARAAIIRFEKYMDSVNPDNQQSVNAMDKAYDNLKKQLSDTDLNQTAATRKELNGRMNQVQAKYDELHGIEPKPAPVEESDDNRKVQSIEKSKATEKAAVIGMGAAGVAANLINTNNVINNSKTIHQQAPVTSTNAPGVYNATSVN